MVADSSATQLGESLIAAKDRIRTGPVPGWVASCPFRVDFKVNQAGHVTYLLFDRQIHAELRQTHFHVALRLDTMQAVQNESPWRLDFEPRHQLITLHWIKTRRGDAQFDHSNLSSARVVDRLAAAPVPQDRLTLLLMLEDVRPGDVLEWCYTVEDRPLLLPEHCAAFFTLPAGTPVGKIHFSLRFNPSRPMQWRSSEPEWRPAGTQDDGETSWVWTRENYPGLQPEENTPDWHMAHPWIQISDCPNWGTIAAAFAEAWPDDNDNAAVAEIAGEIAATEDNVLQQTEMAIQMVQDEYRYLAVPWELDGQPPMPPAVVARRRYGDGKDLSFLLAHLLRRLGVPARLVLVNTVLRKSIAALLPAPALFDHLLVEYSVGGETRWVDATLKRQGGGSLNRVIRDYGAGLPIAGHDSALVEPPGGPARNSSYELKESILLDTTGSWSWLAVVVSAGGSHAEALRQELESEGLEALAKKRLRLCADRFTNARRVGPLEYRDDRAANEFFLAEIFEIKDFLTLDPKTKWYKLEFPNDFIANLLQVPDSSPRRTPFALPHPCNVVHTIELHSIALAPAVVQQRSVESDYLRFTRLRKTLAGNWTMKLTLSTLASTVPPESLDAHRKTLRELRSQSIWSLLVPAGDPRPHQRGDFGVLPVSWKPAPFVPAPAPSQLRPPLDVPLEQPRPGNGAPKTPTAIATPTPAATAIPAATPAVAALKNGAATLSPSKEPGTSMLVRLKRYRRKSDTEPKAKWSVVMLGCALALTLIVIVALVARNADHWGIFRMRPVPPQMPNVNSLLNQ